MILFNGETYTEISFDTDDMHNDTFELKNVMIGVTFTGSVKKINVSKVA